MSSFARELGVSLRLAAVTAPLRWRAIGASATGFCAVAAILIAVLAIANGMSSLLEGRGAPDVAMVTSKGAFAEVGSTLPRELDGLLAQSPGLRGAAQPQTSPEFLATVELPKAASDDTASILLRGFAGKYGPSLHRIELIDGRSFRFGLDEVIVGRRLMTTLRDCSLGQTIPIGDHMFRIVGSFSAAGGIQESEIWGDAAQMSGALGVPGQVNVIYARLASPRQVASFAAFVEGIHGVGASTETQSAYFGRLASRYRQLILVPGIAIVLTMALAAILGSVNTMNSAVHSRLREIATLRAIGYGPGALAVALLVEASMLGFCGGFVGAMLGAWLLHGTAALTSNGVNAMAFEFMPSLGAIAVTVFFAVGIGIVGGLWPAFSAFRLQAAEALRAA